MTRAVAAALLAVGSPAFADAPKLKFSMELGLQARAFLQSAAYPGQGGSDVSVSAEPEFDLAIPNGNVRFVPFARLDRKDDRRSHADIRELTVRQRRGNFDFLAGIGHVFWGTTESVHLVDIVNQTDLVEDPDGEDKLGQSMVNLAWTSPIGVFSGFLLPFHRERTLPGRHGRLRGPIPFDQGKPGYESRHGEDRLDSALRWSLSRGALDAGVSYFHGNAREPRFELTSADDGQPRLRPVYDVIDQVGIDANVVHGGWLLKLEAIHQHSSRSEDYEASAAGFEYTFSGAFGSSWDVGALSEFLWDSRGSDSPSPFQKDLFVGTRLSANDVAGTEVLAGAVFDTGRDAVFGNLEASWRTVANGKLSVELRLFGGDDRDDPLSFFRRDDYLQVEYTQYF